MVGVLVLFGEELDFISGVGGLGGGLPALVWPTSPAAHVRKKLRREVMKGMEMCLWG